MSVSDHSNIHEPKYSKYLYRNKAQMEKPNRKTTQIIKTGTKPLG